MHAATSHQSSLHFARQTAERSRSPTADSVPSYHRHRRTSSADDAQQPNPSLRHTMSHQSMKRQQYYTGNNGTLASTSSSFRHMPSHSNTAPGIPLSVSPPSSFRKQPVATGSGRVVVSEVSVQWEDDSEGSDSSAEPGSSRKTPQSHRTNNSSNTTTRSLPSSASTSPALKPSVRSSSPIPRAIIGLGMPNSSPSSSPPTLDRFHLEACNVPGIAQVVYDTPNPNRSSNSFIWEKSRTGVRWEPLSRFRGESCELSAEEVGHHLRCTLMANVNGEHSSGGATVHSCRVGMSEIVKSRLLAMVSQGQVTFELVNAKDRMPMYLWLSHTGLAVLNASQKEVFKEKWSRTLSVELLPNDNTMLCVKQPEDRLVIVLTARPSASSPLGTVASAILVARLYFALSTIDIAVPCVGAKISSAWNDGIFVESFKKQQKNPEKKPAESVTALAIAVHTHIIPTEVAYCLWSPSSRRMDPISTSKFDSDLAQFGLPWIRARDTLLAMLIDYSQDASPPRTPPARMGATEPSPPSSGRLLTKPSSMRVDVSRSNGNTPPASPPSSLGRKNVAQAQPGNASFSPKRTVSGEGGGYSSPSPPLPSSSPPSFSPKNMSSSPASSSPLFAAAPTASSFSPKHGTGGHGQPHLSMKSPQSPSTGPASRVKGGGVRSTDMSPSCSPKQSPVPTTTSLSPKNLERFNTSGHKIGVPTAVPPRLVDNSDAVSEVSSVGALTRKLGSFKFP